MAGTPVTPKAFLMTNLASALAVLGELEMMLQILCGEVLILDGVMVQWRMCSGAGVQCRIVS